MMKRLIIICLALIGLSGLKAQDVFVPINFASLQKKIQKSDAEIADPKKGSDPKVWVKRGELMLSAFDVDIEQTYEGMSAKNLEIFYKEPAKSTEEFDGKTYDVLAYPHVKFFFENNVLAMYERTESVYENPTDEALKSFKKALELDGEGKYSEKIFEDLTKLKLQVKRDGINDYYRGNKEEALNAFETVLIINKLPVLKGEIDTLMLQYAGIIAREVDQLERSIGHYTELALIDNEPNTYLLIKEDYIKLKDTASAISTLEKAFEVYPDTLNVIANLVDLYIRNGKIEKGLTTITKSIEKNPSKGELYYWKGRLELNTEDEDRITKALEAYNKAIELNPELYYTYYDIGFIYYLQGQDLFTRAGDEKDVKYREEMMKLGTENYEKALPNLEKALELNTTNKEIRKETLDTLKRVYYKLQLMDKYDEATEKLKTM